MARNRTFRRKYTIEVKGVTTNNFMVKFLDSAVGAFFLAAANNFAQLEIITMTAEEIETASKVKEIFKCGKCGATKYTDGTTCLFCAAEGEKDADTHI